MVNASEIETIWKKDRILYEKFGEDITTELNNILKKLEIYGEISFRTKDFESMLKKLYKKNKTYNDIYDKVGARVVVQFKSQLDILDKEIISYFNNRIQKRDNKLDSLLENEFGYQSIHYEIFNKKKSLICEVQIRTVCQHNWSMMSHTLAYKKEENIPTIIKRQINALSALLELVDDQFQNIYDKIILLPSDHNISVSNWIEKKFYSISTSKYDHEMTNIFLQHLKTFYLNENILDTLSEFYSKQENFKKLHDLILSPNSHIFYTQPEIFIIIERLNNKKILLKSKWENIYPIQVLEEIANNWGLTLE